MPLPHLNGILTLGCDMADKRTFVKVKFDGGKCTVSIPPLKELLKRYAENPPEPAPREPLPDLDAEMRTIEARVPDLQRDAVNRWRHAK
jgi:hypothetical protein